MGSGKKLPKLLKWCYKVSWGGKMTATQSSTIALSVKRLKEYSVTLFHHIFWKRTIFKGVPLAGFLGFLVPKVPWGLKKMRKKKFLKGKPIWPFAFNICEPTLSNLLPLASFFLNSATRWRCQTPDSWILCWFISQIYCNYIYTSKELYDMEKREASDLEAVRAEKE